MARPDPPARRRRRAVGPAGSSPAQAPPELDGVRSPNEPSPEDRMAQDDERLLREVPPHHGG